MDTDPTREQGPDTNPNRERGIAPAKHPAWAFALNFFVPGAGLVYLGKPLAGLCNLVVVVAAATAIYRLLTPEAFERHAPKIGLALQVGSGVVALRLAYAQWLAQRHDTANEHGLNESDKETSTDFTD